MTQRFANNFATTVAATFGAIDTQLRVASSVGLPVLAPGEHLLLTVFRLTGIEEREHEVIKVTAVNGDMLTVIRSVEGANATQFVAGDHVESRITAGSLEAKADLSALEALSTQTVADINALEEAVADKASSADLLTTNLVLDGKADKTQVAADIAQAKADLVNSSPAALDTLNELASALGNDANFASTTAAALGNRVRVDAVQALTGPQQTQARSNLGLGNVDNTSDANKPVSTAQAAAITAKLNAVGGKLTGETYTYVDKGSVAAGTVTFNRLEGTVQRLEVTGALTIAISGWTAGDAGFMMLELVRAGSFPVTFPVIYWKKPDGAYTTILSEYLTAIGRTSLQTATDFVVLWSRAGDTVIWGKLV